MPSPLRPLVVDDPTTRTGLPVVVIGAGPVGLAAAAHLLDRGLEPLVLEAGPRVGASVAQWRHVRLFSPWCLALDPVSVRLLAAELRLALEPALESAAALGQLIDPNVHTCGTVPAHGMAELAHPEPGYTAPDALEVAVSGRK